MIPDTEKVLENWRRGQWMHSIQTVSEVGMLRLY